MSIFEDKQKMGLIPFELKNVHNVRGACVPFIVVISGLTQKEKFSVYEDNYYRLQEYISLEQELGIDLYTFFTVKRRGYIYYKALDGSVRKSKVWAQFFGYDWCWYIRNPKKKDRKRVRMKHYNKTWALTEEELK